MKSFDKKDVQTNIELLTRAAIFRKKNAPWGMLVSYNYIAINTPVNQFQMLLSNDVTQI